MLQQSVSDGDSAPNDATMSPGGGASRHIVRFQTGLIVLFRFKKQWFHIDWYFVFKGGFVSCYLKKLHHPLHPRPRSLVRLERFDS